MSKPLTLTRELYVPRELVFDAWSRADHLSAWYPPEGGRLLAQGGGEVTEGEQPGPAQPWEIQWSDADGTAHVERGRCLELERGRRLRWRLQVDDADAELLLRLAGDHGTCALDLEHRMLGAATAPAGYREIWSDRLNRLEAYFSAI